MSNNFLKSQHQQPLEAKLPKTETMIEIELEAESIACQGLYNRSGDEIYIYFRPESQTTTVGNSKNCEVIRTILGNQVKRERAKYFRFHNLTNRVQSKVLNRIVNEILILRQSESQ